MPALADVPLVVDVGVTRPLDLGRSSPAASWARRVS